MDNSRQFVIKGYHLVTNYHEFPKNCLLKCCNINFHTAPASKNYRMFVALK